jgi:hypothetical protein
MFVLTVHFRFHFVECVQVIVPHNALIISQSLFCNIMIIFRIRSAIIIAGCLAFNGFHVIKTLITHFGITKNVPA